MLKAVKDLGEYIIKENGFREEEILTDSSKLTKTNKIISVVFKEEKNNLLYNNVYIEDFDQEKGKKILFRSFRHGRYNAFLTSVITTRKTSKQSIENIRNKWKLWFKSYYNDFNDNTSLKAIKNEIEKNEEIIFKSILEKYETLDKDEKKSCILTVKIRNETDKYASEIPDFLEIFKSTSFEDFYSKHGVIAKGHGCCAFCNVIGDVMPASPFAVFTVNKEGFAYNFNKENAWKQLPICKKCALDLQVGKEWITDEKKLNLSFSLYGYKYFVIPYSLFEGVSDDIMDELELRKSKDYRNGLLNAEDDVLEIIKNKNDFLNLIFVFYKSKQQFFDIIRYVEEVPPSWIKKLYESISYIDLKDIFNERSLKIIFNENWNGSFLDGEWNGNSIWNVGKSGKLAELVKAFFYHREENKKIFDKSGLNILGNVLDNRGINKKYLIKHFIDAIRDEHGNGNKGAEKILSLKSLFLLDLLLCLGIVTKDANVNIKLNGAGFLDKNKKEFVNVDKFFEDFSSAFESSDKKAVFLEGVLTSFLLDIQYVKRKETPFRKKLHGLRLNERLVKRLFPEIIEKLRQYDANYYKWLETLTSKYLIEADEIGWNISSDEISYYFALGLSLGKKFKGGV